MGIYVQSFAARPRTEPSELLAEKIASAARGWATQCGLEALFYAGTPQETGVLISIYPAGDFIRFDIADDRVSFGVKTSIAGPGYHAALIELCDWLQDRLSLKWRWDAGGDETGYARNRDGRALLEQYVSQVDAFCEWVVGEKMDVLKLQLPAELAAGGYDGIATPSGPLPLSFFEEALTASVDQKNNYAPQVMPWWTRSIDSRFWADTLRAIFWTEVEWRSPQTPVEVYVQAAAFACGEYLRPEQSAEFEAALAELKVLTKSQAGTLRPAAEGIGWKRRRRSFELTGSWRVDLPGYYVRQIESDGGTVCLWFGIEEIRGTSWVSRLKSEGVVWAEKFENCLERRLPNGVSYRIADRVQPLKDATGIFMASAEFHADHSDKHHLLFITLCAEKNDVLQRMEDVALGVSFDPPPAPDPAPHLA